MVQGVRIDDENCLVNTNPATGALISKVKCTASEELEEIIRTADTAQKLVWRNKSIQERIDLLKDCITELVAVSNPMIVSIVTEMGKPIGEATEEVQYAVEDQEEYFEILMESITPKSYGKNTVVRQPYGVVAIIRWDKFQYKKKYYQLSLAIVLIPIQYLRFFDILLVRCLRNHK